MLHRLDQVAIQLSRRGMPQGQVARYIEELRDHREDLLAEIVETGVAADAAEGLADERLGSPRALAEAALTAHRKRFFMGRHPWFFFGIMPAFAVPLTIILIMLATILGVMWFTHSVGKESLEWSARTWLLVACCSNSVNYLWPGLIGIPLYRAAWRRGMNWRWRLFSSAIVVAWGTWLHCWAHAGDETHQGLFAMGLPPLPHVTQAVAAITIIALYAWRLDRRARRALAGPEDHAAIPDGAIT